MTVAQLGNPGMQVIGWKILERTENVGRENVLDREQRFVEFSKQDRLEHFYPTIPDLIRRRSGSIARIVSTLAIDWGSFVVRTETIRIVMEPKSLRGKSSDALSHAGPSYRVMHLPSNPCAAHVANMITREPNTWATTTEYSLHDSPVRCTSHQASNKSVAVVFPSSQHGRSVRSSSGASPPPLETTIDVHRQTLQNQIVVVGARGVVEDLALIQPVVPLVAGRCRPTPYRRWMPTTAW